MSGRERTSKFKAKVLGSGGHELLVSVVSLNPSFESNRSWLAPGVFGPSALGRIFARGEFLALGVRHLFPELELSTESG